MVRGGEGSSHVSGPPVRAAASRFVPTPSARGGWAMPTIARKIGLGGRNGIFRQDRKPRNFREKRTEGAGRSGGRAREVKRLEDIVKVLGDDDLVLEEIAQP